MTDKPWIACLDLEGVLVPEIWISVAERVGIDELKLTTRDISDYDKLMTHRFEILRANGLGLSDITDVIAGMAPYDGATDFLDWLRRHHQVVILSDTFAELALPLIEKLGNPTIFCHNLVVEHNTLVGYRLRLDDQKRASVEALGGLGFATLAMGDSFNDATMLKAADAGILFNPPPKVVAGLPELPVVWDYEQAKTKIAECERRRFADLT